jgi:hypothetical protein
MKPYGYRGLGIEVNEQGAADIVRSINIMSPINGQEEIYVKKQIMKEIKSQMGQLAGKVS